MDKDRIHRLRELYARAEDRLKNIEYNATGNLTIPCVNQLRYVGNHLLEYLVHENEADLAEAESHCSRALFDAYEVEALYYLKNFGRFQDEYDDLTITDCVAQYLDWCVTAQGVRDFVDQHSQSQGRGAYYAAFDPHVGALRQIHTRIPHAREQLNRKRREGRRNQLWVYAGIIVGLGFGIFAWVKPDLGKDLWDHLFGTKAVASARHTPPSTAVASTPRIQ